MKLAQAALYARVSSEAQASAQTIQSQLAALQTRIKAAGDELTVERHFIDEGYSGSTLVRPALERLRDLVAAGAVDRLYIHSPDRLARKYAYHSMIKFLSIDNRVTVCWRGCTVKWQRPCT